MMFGRIDEGLLEEIHTLVKAIEAKVLSQHAVIKQELSELRDRIDNMTTWSHNAPLSNEEVAEKITQKTASTKTPLGKGSVFNGETPPMESLEAAREAMERSDAWVKALFEPMSDAERIKDTMNDMAKAHEKDIEFMRSAGIKLDDGKVRMDLLPFRSLTAVGEVLTFGARKYGDWNWTLVDDAERRFAAAMLRHYAAIQRGEEYDLETGLTHAAHMATSALFVLYFTMLRHDDGA